MVFKRNRSIAPGFSRGRCGVNQKSIGKNFVNGINPDPMDAGRILINALQWIEFRNYPPAFPGNLCRFRQNPCKSKTRSLSKCIIFVIANRGIEFDTDLFALAAARDRVISLCTDLKSHLISPVKSLLVVDGFIADGV